MSRANRDRRMSNRLERAATGQRPSFLDEAPLALVEKPPRPADQARFLNAANTYLRLYSLGECSVIVTRELGRWHLSIAHPRRDPTWREIAEARYRLIPEGVVAALILPPLAAYINHHSRCYQVHEIDDPDFAPVEMAAAEGVAHA